MTRPPAWVLGRQRQGAYHRDAQRPMARQRRLLGSAPWPRGGISRRAGFGIRFSGRECGCKPRRGHTHCIGSGVELCSPTPLPPHSRPMQRRELS